MDDDKQQHNKTYLKHILDAIVAIEGHVKNVNESDFITNRLIYSAVIRELEIIGEATKNISMDFRNAHANIPWKEMAGMRDNLTHGYFAVDLELVWNTVKEQLPPLKKQILKLLEANNS